MNNKTKIVLSIIKEYFYLLLRHSLFIFIIFFPTYTALCIFTFVLFLFFIYFFFRQLSFNIAMLVALI